MVRERLLAIAQVEAVNLAGLASYIGLLTKWNRRINLTSCDVDPVTYAAIDRLIIEPVLASSLVVNPDVTVIDLGSGGGSPAIPFKLQLPDSRMIMVESRSRKCAFLREATRHLGLRGASVEECRFELLTQRVHLKASADVITVRAVRLDDNLVELIRWLAGPGCLVFRFASQNDRTIPQNIRLLRSHDLVPSLESELQILKVVV